MMHTVPTVADSAPVNTPSAAWTGSTLIDLLAPDPAAITAEDVALGLSRTPRFGGLTIPGAPAYSVAWHSLFVEQLADLAGAPLTVRLQALLHDAPEWLLGDVPSPLKGLLPDFRRLEAVMWGAVASRWSVPEDLDPRVHEWDALALAAERLHLIPEGAWSPAPELGPEVEAIAAAWFNYVRRNDPHGEGRFARSLFKAKLNGLLTMRDAEEGRA